MGLEIYWTDYAKIEVKSIYIFLKREASIEVARKTTKEITNEVKRLENLPQLGQIEASLKDRTKEFRYLIYGNYKIIYWINLNKKRIEIWDVFDCRQEPLKIKRTK